MNIRVPSYIEVNDFIDNSFCNEDIEVGMINLIKFRLIKYSYYSFRNSLEAFNGFLSGVFSNSSN